MQTEPSYCNRVVVVAQRSGAQENVADSLARQFNGVLLPPDKLSGRLVRENLGEPVRISGVVLPLGYAQKVRKFLDEQPLVVAFEIGAGQPVRNRHDLYFYRDAQKTLGNIPG